MSLYLVCQIAMPLFALTAVALLQRGRPIGNLVGLAGQPFWVAAAWLTENWGLMVVNAAFAGLYVVGVRAWWLDRQRERQTGRLRRLFVR